MSDHSVTHDKKRRTLLKGLGVGALGSIAGIQTGEATTPSGQIAGASYDTLTGKAGGPVSGTINVDNNQLQGQLNIAGFSLPLGRLEHVEDTASNAKARYSATLSDSKFRAGDVPLKLSVRQEDDHFSGVISRPSTEYGLLGFFVRDEARSNPDKSLAGLNPHGKWAESPHTFEVPKRGLPTDSSLDRLLEIAKPSVDGNLGGDSR